MKIKLGLESHPLPKRSFLTAFSKTDDPTKKEELVLLVVLLVLVLVLVLLVVEASLVYTKSGDGEKKKIW